MPSSSVSVEILGGDRQVARGELLRRCRATSRYRFSTDVRRSCVGDRATSSSAPVVPVRDVEPPGRDARARPDSTKTSTISAVAVAGQRAAERRAVALADDGARDAGVELGAREVARARRGRRRPDSSAEVGRAVAGLHDRLEPGSSAATPSASGAAAPVACGGRDGASGASADDRGSAQNRHARSASEPVAGSPVIRHQPAPVRCERRSSSIVRSSANRTSAVWTLHGADDGRADRRRRCCRRSASRTASRPLSSKGGPAGSRPR